ncbi:pilus assembly FimT family protein [Malaciobacter marinus]|uniref:pilus assembly FimT family protein n=1 Tax=Malaciobacter marinus TaxID=505249 RepID=UPI003B00ACB2
MNKKSYSLIELLFVLTLISIITASFYSNINFDKFQSNIDLATNRLILYLKQTRYQALIDNKAEENQTKWHKKR